MLSRNVCVCVICLDTRGTYNWNVSKLSTLVEKRTIVTTARGEMQQQLAALTHRTQLNRKTAVTRGVHRSLFTTGADTVAPRTLSGNRRMIILSTRRRGLVYRLTLIRFHLPRRVPSNFAVPFVGPHTHTHFKNE